MHEASSLWLRVEGPMVASLIQTVKSTVKGSCSSNKWGPMPLPYGQWQLLVGASIENQWLSVVFSNSRSSILLFTVSSIVAAIRVCLPVMVGCAR